MKPVKNVSLDKEHEHGAAPSHHRHLAHPCTPSLDSIIVNGVVAIKPPVTPLCACASASGRHGAGVFHTYLPT